MFINKNSRLRGGLVTILLAIFLVKCTRSSISSNEEALRLAKAPENISDDLDFQDFGAVIDRNIKQLNKFDSKDRIMTFGPIKILTSEYILALSKLRDSLKNDPTGGEFLRIIDTDFQFMEVYGDKKWGEVFVTSYYEPVIQGRKTPSGSYTQPLWGVPTDLVKIDMGEFTKAFSEFRSFYDLVTDKSRDGLLRGRLVKGDSRNAQDRVVPYYSRAEIEDGDMLKGVSQILCYVDPIDGFFLQIQGSGKILLEGGKEMYVGYAEQNGHSYRAIGKFLLDKIPKDEMTAQKIIAHLRSLNEKGQRELLNQNPSYIFFQKLENGGLTSFGNRVEAGRTIATDTKFFPKGALAYLKYERPIFALEGSDQVTRFETFSRFVLDQDTGGAIRGPHRVDLFWGLGDEAAKVSGVMRNPGTLYYLIPKSTISVK